jgi:hypothetical protein
VTNFYRRYFDFALSFRAKRLIAHPGGWSSTSPVSYGFQSRRCDGAGR